MPCEACNVQFTVFRRKRCCSDCKRFYCSSCLCTGSTRITLGPLCERCAVFSKRPLLRVDLLQLKPKDLIFYLQSKHISTAGCVEKDELVSLVLNHIQQADAASTGHHSNGGATPRSFDPSSHSFDALKQSCQNFFTNISDKVDAFASEAKQKPQATSNRATSPGSAQGTTHITEQPRVSTREIPSYASFQVRPPSPTTAADTAAATTANSTPNNSSQTSSPVEGSRTVADHNELAPSSIDLIRNEDKNLSMAAASVCDCSDDEIISTFRGRNNLSTGDSIQSPQSSPSLENPVASTSGSSSTGATSTSLGTKKSSPSLKIESYDESSESSFEELGAIGGISDDSKTCADNAPPNNEPWQFVEKEAARVDASELMPLTVALLQPNVNQQQVQITMRPKKVARRRSDGYLNRRRQQRLDDESPTSPSAHCLDRSSLREENGNENEPVTQQNNRNSCQRCGKNKTNIRKHIDTMRRHLQSSQMSETEIKRELAEFLIYLEKRTKSIDCSDSEATAASPVSVARDINNHIPEDSAAHSHSEAEEYDENDGIHVYAAPASYSGGLSEARFLNLEDFESLAELENLSVKRLKEVLMLNRVDYKGCCEKQELLDRVVRLWKNLKSTPGVDKLPTDELCKICMDAPIECVILECGHMATCTNCGKVLSECPICRQYIVRVVRFFKA